MACRGLSACSLKLNVETGRSLMGAVATPSERSNLFNNCTCSSACRGDYRRTEPVLPALINERSTIRVCFPVKYCNEEPRGLFAFAGFNAKRELEILNAKHHRSISASCLLCVVYPHFFFFILSSSYLLVLRSRYSGRLSFEPRSLSQSRYP